MVSPGGRHEHALPFFEQLDKVLANASRWRRAPDHKQKEADRGAIGWEVYTKVGGDHWIRTVISVSEAEAAVVTMYPVRGRTVENLADLMGQESE